MPGTRWRQIIVTLVAVGDRATLGSVAAITHAGNALPMAVPFAGARRPHARRPLTAQRCCQESR